MKLIKESRIKIQSWLNVRWELGGELLFDTWQSVGLAHICTRFELGDCSIYKSLKKLKSSPTNLSG